MTVVALVPTYNGARFLTDTLASLAAQDYPALRVLVSDDGSSDETWDICEAFRKRDGRFTAVRQPARLGWIGNSNWLLARADGDYAFFAPHDDLFEPSYVSRMVVALAQRPDAVLAFAHTLNFEPDGSRTTRTAEQTVRPGGRVRRGLRYLGEGDTDRWTPFRGVVRAAALQDVGGLRPSWSGEIDADGRWLFRLHLLGPFVRVPEVLCRKRRHPDSLHKSWARPKRTLVARRAAYAREVLAADLAVRERVALLAAVGVASALLCLPDRARAWADRWIRVAAEPAVRLADLG